MKLNIVHINNISSEPPDTGERYFKRYHWIDIYFNSDVASRANQNTEAFKRGITWYAGYRWFHGKRNAFLDSLIDSGKFELDHISRSEYNLYYRTWSKRLRLNGW